MKEKLIQILSTAPPGHVGIGPTDEDLADTILAALRCDKCKHWEGWQTYGECKVNTVNMERLETEPDFFCSHWEANAFTR